MQHSEKKRAGATRHIEKPSMSAEIIGRRECPSDACGQRLDADGELLLAFTIEFPKLRLALAGSHRIDELLPQRIADVVQKAEERSQTRLWFAGEKSGSRRAVVVKTALLLNQSQTDHCGPVVTKDQDGEADTASAASEASKPQRAFADRASIAVLPFDTLSGDPEQVYFADGMVDEIITGLSRVKWLFVIARNSSFIYKGRALDVKQVGYELGVRYILEGSVRKSAARVRVTSQLIDATTGAHLWAERYEREFHDIFALQDDITLSVIGAIEPSLRLAEVERVKRKRPDSLDAYDLILRAQPDVYAAMPAQAKKALPYLERAIALEPNYALAHAYAAMCHHSRFSGPA